MAMWVDVPEALRSRLIKWLRTEAQDDEQRAIDTLNEEESKEFREQSNAIYTMANVLDSPLTLMRGYFASGTGCEPYLTGWELARSNKINTKGILNSLIVGNDVLQGYVDCCVQRALGNDVSSQDAGLRYWTSLSKLKG